MAEGQDTDTFHYVSGTCPRDTFLTVSSEYVRAFHPECPFPYPGTGRHQLDSCA